MDAVRHLALGDKHDDGDLGHLPDPGANCPAVHHRQHDIQQNKVRDLPAKLLQGPAAVGGDTHIEALFHKIHLNEVGNIMIVFYHQNIASHGDTSE